jgi:hypothetical protein
MSTRLINTVEDKAELAENAAKSDGIVVNLSPDTARLKSVQAIGRYACHWEGKALNQKWTAPRMGLPDIHICPAFISCKLLVFAFWIPPRGLKAEPRAGVWTDGWVSRYLSLSSDDVGAPYTYVSSIPSISGRCWSPVAVLQRTEVFEHHRFSYRC